MSLEKVTIKDVARLAGVGLGTASRVVSGKGSVSPATLERVKRAIEELDFRPSHAARSLLSGSSRMIGVYLPVLKGTFYMPILQTIDGQLRAAGLHMVVAFGLGLGVGDERRQCIEGIAFLIERGCDGLVVMGEGMVEEDLAGLGAKLDCLVVLNHSFESIPDQCFSADHTRGGALAARALLDQGHRALAVVAGPASLPDNVARIDGFMAEVAAAGIDTSTVWVAESDFSPEGGWAAARDLAGSGYHFTGLFCANDEMALGALSFFQQAGIAVPQQVSVIGYDDTPSAEFSAPRLSTVHVPWNDVTHNALNALLERCYDLPAPPARALPITVTQRASLAPPPRQAGETK
ncbi:LacI family DNA-binding transcriptional regulator [Massilia glaciei]|uniref:LacI family DNA-binding transcriptional regulator n=1 Tax=Massilia glaciei TaxID=1524097 RepID=A0A2U2HIH3_9BURK|nr:LacI family DNA-binding transcriptional regulator [Massilia glaciei]PWF46098.1 LacI family DNA-binding transcriptional regulator [Massilia glaciei]